MEFKLLFPIRFPKQYSDSVYMYTNTGMPLVVVFIKFKTNSY